MIKIAKGPPRGERGEPLELSFDGDVPSISQKSDPVQASRSKARLRYLARRLHALGPKPLFHFLDELERGADLRGSLEEYAALPPDFIWANGGDQFPAPFVTGGGGRAP
jgi:hypothetical protein